MTFTTAEELELAERIKADTRGGKLVDNFYITKEALNFFAQCHPRSSRSLTPFTGYLASDAATASMTANTTFDSSSQPTPPNATTTPKKPRTSKCNCTTPSSTTDPSTL